MSFATEQALLSRVGERGPVGAERDEVPAVEVVGVEDGRVAHESASEVAVINETNER